MRFELGDIVRIAENAEALNDPEISFLKGINGVVRCLDNQGPTSDPIVVDWEHPESKKLEFSHREDELRLVRRQ